MRLLRGDVADLYVFLINILINIFLRPHRIPFSVTMMKTQKKISPSKLECSTKRASDNSKEYFDEDKLKRMHSRNVQAVRVIRDLIKRCMQQSEKSLVPTDLSEFSRVRLKNYVVAAEQKV